MTHPIPDEALDADIAILGKKGRGKTIVAKGVVERLLEMERRVLVFDPLSTWWGLRSNAEGDGPGFPIAVFGGPKGDMPLTESMGRPLARIVAENNLPMVVDMGNMRKAEWQRLVREMCDELFTVNRDPLWLILEEADVFAPQNPMKGDSAAVLGEIDRIARRGRAFGFRLISITQRPARIHKDVLTQLSTLVALGVTGPQDREAIKAWIDGNADRDQSKEVMDSLAKLPVGTGWVWAPDQDLLEKVRFPMIKTLDTSKTPKAGEKRIEPTKLADVDLTAIKAALEEKSDTKGPVTSISAKPDQRAIKDARASGYASGLSDGKREGAATERARINEGIAQVLRIPGEPNASIPAQEDQIPSPSAAVSSTKLSPSAAKILGVIVGLHPRTVSYNVAATRAGISKRSSAFRAYRKELLTAGLVQIIDGQMLPMNGALDLAPPIPQGLDEWASRLPPSQSAMLGALRQMTLPITRDVLAEMAGISPTSSGLGSGIRELIGLGLAEIEGGNIKLAE